MAKGAAGTAGDGKAAKGTDDGQKPAEGKAAEGTDDGQKAAEGDKSATPPPEKKPEKTFTKAELEAERQKAIADAKKKWDEEKDLTELERLKKENEELRNSNRLRDAKEEVLSQLQAEGNKSPALAFEAIKGQLAFDDSGKITNAKDLIANLKTNFPEQFGTEKPAGGIDAGAGQGQKGTALTIEAIEKMTPDQINANWAEVSKVLASK